MIRIANYDSENVSLIAGAIPITDGKAEEFVTVEADEDSFGEEIGADGSVCRFATHNTLYTVTVRLKGYSEHNAQLHALHALDASSPNGSGIGAFMLKDGNGSTLMASDKCYIKKAPPKSLGKTIGDCEWVLRVVATPAQMLVGGN